MNFKLLAKRGHPKCMQIYAREEQACAYFTVNDRKPVKKLYSFFSCFINKWELQKLHIMRKSSDLNKVDGTKIINFAVFKTSRFFEFT